MFKIGFKEDLEIKLLQKDCFNHKEGLIMIDDYYETFFSSMEEMTKQSYKKQWLEAFNIIQTQDKSAFLINFYPHKLKKAKIYGEWWILYKNIKKGKIVFQNQLIIKEKIDKGLNLSNWYNYIDDYYSYAEDGEKISEWYIDEYVILNKLKNN